MYEYPSPINVPVNENKTICMKSLADEATRSCLTIDKRGRKLNSS